MLRQRENGLLPHFRAQSGVFRGDRRWRSLWAIVGLAAFAIGAAVVSLATTARPASSWNPSGPLASSSSNEDDGSVMINAGTGAEKIVDGQTVPDRFTYPFVARITCWTNAFCTGAMIDDSHLITAAHCTSRCPLDQLGVETLRWDSFLSLDVDGGMRYNVTATTVHPSFSAVGGIMRHDLAIWTLKLVSQGLMNTRISVALSTDPNLAHIGSVVTLSGWGVPCPYCRPTRYLQSVQLEVRAPSFCAQQYNVPWLAEGDVTCAGGGIGSSCQGDSGGPMFISDGSGGYVIVGITSWGPSACELEDYPGGYTNVGYHEQWITAVLRGSDLAEPTTSFLTTKEIAPTSETIGATASSLLTFDSAETITIAPAPVPATLSFALSATDAPSGTNISAATSLSATTSSVLTSDSTETITIAPAPMSATVSVVLSPTEVLSEMTISPTTSTPYLAETTEGSTAQGATSGAIGMVTQNSDNAMPTQIVVGNGPSIVPDSPTSVPRTYPITETTNNLELTSTTTLALPILASQLVYADEPPLQVIGTTSSVPSWGAETSTITTTSPSTITLQAAPLLATKWVFANNPISEGSKLIPATSLEGVPTSSTEFSLPATVASLWTQTTFTPLPGTPILATKWVYAKPSGNVVTSIVSSLGQTYSSPTSVSGSDAQPTPALYLASKLVKVESGNSDDVVIASTTGWAWRDTTTRRYLDCTSSGCSLDDATPTVFRVVSLETKSDWDGAHQSAGSLVFRQEDYCLGLDSNAAPLTFQPCDYSLPDQILTLIWVPKMAGFRIRGAGAPCLTTMKSNGTVVGGYCTGKESVWVAEGV